MPISSSGSELVDALKGKLKFEQTKNRIIGRDANNLARLLILADGVNFVMKTSKPGFDVLYATDAQLLFNSNQNIFKIVQTGDTSFAAPTSPNSSSFVNVVHNLGYQPLVIAFVSFTPTGTRYPIPYLLPQFDTDTQPGVLAWQIGMELVGDTTITFFHRHLTRYITQTNYIKYYILQETAS